MFPIVVATASPLVCHKLFVSIYLVVVKASKRSRLLLPFTFFSSPGATGGGGQAPLFAGKTFPVLYSRRTSQVVEDNDDRRKWPGLIRPCCVVVYTNNGLGRHSLRNEGRNMRSIVRKQS